jgi:hypothetical protein
MSLQSTQSDGDGRPAEDEGRSFTTGIGSMVAPAEDDETAPPTRPTFTARPSEPAVSPVPEQASAPDDVAEQVSTAPTSPDLGPYDGVSPAELDAAPDAGPVPDADPVPDAGPAAVDGDQATAAGPGAAEIDQVWARPVSTAAGLDEPLLVDGDGFRARWQRAQAGFIDDPREAVGDAADLIEQTAQALVGALRQRQRQLRVLWESGPADGAPGADGQAGADTEHLRLMMQRYRALFNQLCRP